MTGAELDVTRLRDFLARTQPGLVTGPLTAEVIAGGRSNLTYTIGDRTHRWILRRPPLGHVLATAHNMAREHRVMAALAGSSVPVPRMVLLYEDSDVIGAPFLMMQEVSGTVYRSLEQTRTLGRERARRLSFALVEILSELHSIDPSAIGLGDFGRPEGYLQRQLARWRAQLEASRSRELPALEALYERLAGKQPPETQRTALLHGDFRLDNTIVARDDRILAVVDWEMSTLGDALADLGLFAVYWDGLAEMPDNPVAAGVQAQAGFPAARELVEHYAARTGADLSDLPWYVGLGHFKLAVIAEGIHFRNLQGKTVGPGFGRVGEIVVPLAERGLDLLAKGE